MKNETIKSKRKIKQGDRIVITFLDAFGRGSWNDLQDVESGFQHHITCEITGYYIAKDKNYLVLSMGFQTLPQSKPFLHLEFIPVGAIQSIKITN